MNGPRRLRLPTIYSPNATGLVLKVGAVKVVSTPHRIIPYVVTNEGEYLRLPDQLTEWAIIAELVRSPGRVEFGILNGRAYAEFLDVPPADNKNTKSQRR